MCLFEDACYREKGKGVDLLNGHLFFNEKGDVLWISELSVKEERREYQKEWE